MRILTLPDALRALNSRNYRLFFTAQAISLTGLWMHRIAIGWLVYRLTGSNSALGIMDFAASIPIFFLTPFAGALIESWDLRKTLVCCQTGCMCVAFTLALLTFTGLVSFRLVLCLCLALGCIDAFEMPCRYSLVSYMVDRKEDVSNAVALNAMNFNTARMIGPTIGGFVIHMLGEGVCFLINGFAYSSTLFAVSKMKMKEPPIGKKGSMERHPIADMVEGFKMARDFAPFKYILLLSALTCFFGYPAIILMPAMAKSVLGGTSETLGLLLMGVAIGSVSGCVIMASRKSTVTHAWWCTRTCIGFGIAALLFSLSRSIAVGIILAAPVGFCMTTCTIAGNALLQSMVPTESRSRIMGIYTFAIIGVPPFGSLLSGRLGDLFGTNWSLFICGICCTATALYFTRRIDRLKGEITEALRGQGAA